jgi:Mg-chelatase subunit ChlD
LVIRHSSLIRHSSFGLRHYVAAMFDYQLTFASPHYLALLALLPMLWWYSFRGMAALGRVRRFVVLATRSLVLLLLILALAEIQAVRTSDRLTVIFLLDQSLSIPEKRSADMIAYVNAQIAAHRREGDRAGVIVFGREAAIEIPPFDEGMLITAGIESPLERNYTNLAAAMKLAQASFPEGAAKRIVLISDGNENLGNAAEQAESLAAAGIGIDVLPVRYRLRAQVLMERLTMPDTVRLGEPFELKIVVNNTAEATAADAGAARGRLILSRSADGRKVEVSNQPVTLPPGKRVFTLTQRIDRPNFYTYEARFVPAPDGRDRAFFTQNKEVTAFTQVHGKGDVLLIEDYEHTGEFDRLVERLRGLGLEVTVRGSNNPFADPADLVRFDAVLLANVPREHFTDEQIRMLVGNTQVMGAGLVMLGGPNSFGAGGWTNSDLEKAMPVDFQIKNAEVVPRGALMMVLDKSGSMAGQKIELSKAAAIEAARVLGRHDYVGVVAFDEQAHAVVPMQPAGDLRGVARRIDRLAGGGGTNMQPGMMAGYQALREVDASIKHMIVLTDGITAGTGYPALAARMRQDNITVSCVAVGTDAARDLMAEIATAGGGNSYYVVSPRAIPRIFQGEARTVARPLIWDKHPVRPRVTATRHKGMLSGIGDPLPPIKGFVLTSRKTGSMLPETLIVSPEPAGDENNTILAVWTYGLGKAVAFTSDAGARWTDDWTNQDNQEVYDRLFGQMVRGAMRPLGDSGRFTTATEVTDGQARVVLSALDINDEFLNFLSISGTAFGPDLRPRPMKIEQVAPGRYVGTFPASDPGSYFISITAIRPSGEGGEEGEGKGKSKVEVTSIRTGVSVAYSDEFRARAANEPLLARLAGMVPRGGVAGTMIEPARNAAGSEALLAVNTFRHDLPKAASSRDAWHYILLLGSCLFFFDVFFRRVQVGFAWAPRLAGRVRDWVLRRQKQAAKPAYIERLQSRKAAVAAQIEQIRAAARLEPAPKAPGDLAALEEPAAAPVDERKSATLAAPSLAGPPQNEEDTYTARLLRAKENVWKKRDDKDT